MKPFKLSFANGLQLTPEETANLLTILFQVGFEKPTEKDRLLAQKLLLKIALTCPEYANYSR